MIAVDASQLTRLQASTELPFVRAEAQKLASFAPPLAAAAGRAGLEAAVRLGLEATRRAGFTEPAQIRLYLQLMASFGSHFNTDPQYQWLHGLLSEAEGAGAYERARLLHWHATLYLERTYGKKGAHGIAAGMRATRLDVATLAEIGADYGTRGPYLLARLHPQRAPYLSGAVARLLLEKATKDANTFGLGGAAAAPLLLCLMYGFGHGVANDPLYPWVHATLSSKGLSGAAKTDELFARAQSTLASMLQPVSEARR